MKKAAIPSRMRPFVSPESCNSPHPLVAPTSRSNGSANNDDEGGPQGREHELALDYHDRHASPARIGTPSVAMTLHAQAWWRAHLPSLSGPLPGAGAWAVSIEETAH